MSAPGPGSMNGSEMATDGEIRCDATGRICDLAITAFVRLRRRKRPNTAELTALLGTIGPMAATYCNHYSYGWR
jgi:hypothetical protein